MVGVVVGVGVGVVVGVVVGVGVGVAVGVAVGVVVVVGVGVGVGVVVGVGVAVGVAVGVVVVVVVGVGVGVAVGVDMTEQQLTRAIIDAVNASGLAYVWRNQAGKVRVRGGWLRMSPEGTPDIVGYTLRGHRRGSGIFVGLEVKLPKGKLTGWQQNFLTLASGFVGVVRNVDEAISLLRSGPEQIGPLRESTPDNAASPASVARIGQRETSAVGARLAGWRLNRLPDAGIDVSGETLKRRARRKR